MEELFLLWTCLDFFIPFCVYYRDYHCGSYTGGCPPTNLLITIISTYKQSLCFTQTVWLHDYASVCGVVCTFTVLIVHVASYLTFELIFCVKPHVHWCVVI